ncbi:hypothetical protein RJ55_01512 [Drechmeria coniospora]|nr:hypothetical protein RJ55_01512 [Drechmeria coniospora]
MGERRSHAAYAPEERRLSSIDRSSTIFHQTSTSTSTILSASHRRTSDDEEQQARRSSYENNPAPRVTRPRPDSLAIQTEPSRVGFGITLSRIHQPNQLLGSRNIV